MVDIERSELSSEIGPRGEGSNYQYGSGTIIFWAEVID
jgi:hypothetical protein